MIIPGGAVYDVKIMDTKEATKDTTLNGTVVEYSLYKTTDGNYYGHVCFAYNGCFSSFYKTYSTKVSSGQLIADAFEEFKNSKHVLQPDWND